jgi:F-type H+-transporting ATPase subunit b
LFTILKDNRKMELVTPQIGLIFWTTVSFLILMVILKKFAWAPILGAVKEREASIKKALESAEVARKEMASLQADNERILKEARSERDAMLAEAREMKTTIISEAKNSAKEEADKMVASAKAVIENEKAAAVTELKNSVGALSIEIAEKVLKSELKDADKQNAFITEMLKDVKLN